MPLWLFLIITFGAILGFGFVYDWFSKRKKSSEEIQFAAKNLTPAEIVYTENLLQQGHDRPSPY